jgi:thioredoxin 1
MSEVRELKEQEFINAVSGPVPVVVDFFAPWCGPCKMMSPVIDQIAKEFEGRAQVYKVNIDDNQEIASKYGIMSVPTIMFFKNSKEVGRSVGVVGINEMKRKIEGILK